MSTTVSNRTRTRGRGNTPEERARSRAAFKAWDTRRAEAAKRVRAARKATRTRNNSR